tara:strand:+ start:149 stop:1327 length:1179 start_codon:yes stop_codon:yes gene_type:complete
MYDIHVGEQKSLVFPIMCNAYVSIGYDDNIPDIEGTPSDTTDDVPYGLWAHEGDFSFEAIVTPYDINGESSSRDRANAQPEKVMPNTVSTVAGQSNTIVNQSDYYLSLTGDGRLNHQMTIFNNTKFSVSLMNTTTTTINQPAEYKIRVTFDQFETYAAIVDSSTVITASKARMDVLQASTIFDEERGFNEDGFRTFDDIGIVYPSQANSGQADINIGLNYVDYANLPVGSELFTRDGFTYTSLGTILSFPSSNTLRMSQDLTSNLTTSPVTNLFVESYKEPKYIDNTHHIAVSYLESAKLVQIFYNGLLVGSGTRNSSSPAFVFDRSRCLIGRASNSVSNAENYAFTARQFMGEIHELCIEKMYKTKYSYMHGLLPKFSETLLYLRFEEVDL